MQAHERKQSQSQGQDDKHEGVQEQDEIRTFLFGLENEGASFLSESLLKLDAVPNCRDLLVYPTASGRKVGYWMALITK